MLATFSLHSVVNDAGAYAGLASLIGLALLVLLYFAQAREIRRLSNWIDDEDERRAAAPQPLPRATVLASGVPAAPLASGAVTTAVPGVRRVAVPAAATAPPALAGVAPVAAPALQGPLDEAAPAGEAPPAPVAEPAAPEPMPVIGPATAAAQSEAAQTPESPAEVAAVPLAGPHVPSAEPDAGRLAAAVEAESAALTAVSLRSAAEPAVEEPLVEEPARAVPARAVPVPADPVPAAPVPAPRVTAEHVAAARAAPAAEPAPLAPSTAAAARPRFPPPPGARSEPIAGSASAMMMAGGPRVALEADREPFVIDPTRRRPGGRGPGDPNDPRGGDGSRPPRSPWPAARLLLVAIVIVAVLIFAVTQLFGGNGSKSPTGAGGTTTTHSTTGAKNPSATTKPPPPAPDTITVSVLNGTTVTHLASGAWAKLAARGFKQGAVADAPAQDHVRTIVGYVTGERAAAVEVAADLGVSAAGAQPVDSASLTAGSAGGISPQVVVTLGSEYANSR